MPPILEFHVERVRESPEEVTLCAFLGNDHATTDCRVGMGNSEWGSLEDASLYRTALIKEHHEHKAP